MRSEGESGWLGGCASNGGIRPTRRPHWACHEVHVAAHLADEADDPPFSAGTFGLFLRQGFDKTPGEVWFAPDDEGGIVGYYRMQL